MFKRFLKNEKGLTLIELLVVIVILGIIAAIAIPAVGSLIDNSKTDAHIANAEQMASAARMAIAQDGDGTKEFSMQDLITAGYLEAIPESPGNEGDYDSTASKVEYDGTSYTVTLSDGTHAYIDGSVAVTELTRASVELEATP
ncbi:prepilin-type N-terminal cleavage/methylation domain-containing protein [Guptibacillus algicola]|uniref:prepilin-type N-terminal cleavage/methylation domain-containing protein n=1 Tax=Guptibacillus algicola TaxID=225844 RepID=UPI001CD673C7|nr:prepilin-type N-terminal cleavage/methylation domain-containing protein [Alkalihalobacillus algicola]MCA0986223.1 prepilin-type N-terminal cleavage/methylation domain-containing protein [Alkalihalobacillus algicola]